MQDVNGKNRKLYAFVMTLSHSRYRYVEFAFSQDQVSWAQLHVNAFNFFGGVPSRVILDNLKAGVIKPDIYDPTLNETYSELSRFYGFTIDPTKVFKPEHKRRVSYCTLFQMINIKLFIAQSLFYLNSFCYRRTLLFN